MTNLVAAYQRNEILEFEKILKVCYSVFLMNSGCMWQPCRCCKLVNVSYLLNLYPGHFCRAIEEQSWMTCLFGIILRTCLGKFGHKCCWSLSSPTPASVSHLSLRHNSFSLWHFPQILLMLFSAITLLSSALPFWNNKMFVCIEWQELNIPEKDVEHLLVSLILDNRVQGHIDQVNQLLELGDRYALHSLSLLYILPSVLACDFHLLLVIMKCQRSSLGHFPKSNFAVSNQLLSVCAHQVKGTQEIYSNWHMEHPTQVFIPNSDHKDRLNCLCSGLCWCCGKIQQAALRRHTLNHCWIILLDYTSPCSLSSYHVLAPVDIVAMMNPYYCSPRNFSF